MEPATFSTGKFTSHRKYWRKHLNPRGFDMYPIGEYGPAPCNKKSRWRRYAFTHYDVLLGNDLSWGDEDFGINFQVAMPHVVTVEKVDLNMMGLSSSSGAAQRSLRRDQAVSLLTIFYRRG